MCTRAVVAMVLEFLHKVVATGCFALEGGVHEGKVWPFLMPTPNSSNSEFWEILILGHRTFWKLGCGSGHAAKSFAPPEEGTDIYEVCTLS